MSQYWLHENGRNINIHISKWGPRQDFEPFPVYDKQPSWSIFFLSPGPPKSSRSIVYSSTLKNIVFWLEELQLSRGSVYEYTRNSREGYPSGLYRATGKQICVDEQGVPTASFQHHVSKPPVLRLIEAGGEYLHPHLGSRQGWDTERCSLYFLKTYSESSDALAPVVRSCTRLHISGLLFNSYDVVRWAEVISMWNHTCCGRWGNCYDWDVQNRQRLLSDDLCSSSKCCYGEFVWVHDKTQSICLLRIDDSGFNIRLCILHFINRFHTLK